MYSLATTLLAQVTIVFIPFTGTIPYVNYNCETSGYSGLYHKETQTAYVCEGKWRKKDDYTAQFAMYHELGHHLWYNITQEQRDEYTKEWNKAKVFYRDYGKTRVDEDFSDNFALLSLDQKTSFQVNKRIKLIKSYGKTYLNHTHGLN